MIVFTTITQIPQEILDYLGTSIAARFNLTSLFQDAIHLNSLVDAMNMIPYEYRINPDDIRFDIEYHSNILNNLNSFLEFMDIVATNILNPGMITQVLIQESDFRNIIVESVVKLIQQRYGINSFIVKDVDDLMYLREQDPSIQGLFTLDADMDRWRSIRFSDQLRGDMYDMG